MGNQEKPAKETVKRGALIRWQKPNVGVLIALIPCVLSSVYRFGWRSVAVMAATVGPAFVAEWLFTRTRKQPVTSAVFVTAILLAMILPPTLPLWMAAVGALVAIVFAKEAFGGFGANVFNPAMTGRLFLYVCFATPMTARWSQAGGGALSQWATDAVTGATPLAHVKATLSDPAAANALNGLPSWLDLLLGDRAGCLGETMGLAILLGGAYLLVKKYADYRPVAGSILGLIAATLALRLAGVEGVPDPLWSALSGGFLFAAVFMVTDPVSSARRPQAKWIFGIMVGVLSVALRRFGPFPEGVMFAVVFMNIFNPTLDILFPKKTSPPAKAAP